MDPEKGDVDHLERVKTNSDQTVVAVGDAEIEKQENRSTTYVPDPQISSHHKSPIEKRLVRKADAIILTLAALVFFVAYLDRNGIGNARIMGLQKDLHMSNSQYQNCLTLFIVGYMIFLLQANVLLRYFHPNQIVGVAVLIFGSLVAAMSAAKDTKTVLAMRFFVGAAQAFIQGLGIYIGLWYKRDEFATRAGLYYSAATISGAFGGLIAYGVQSNLTLEATGKTSWRWLFIIDGAISLGVGATVLLLLPKFPDKITNGKHWLFSKEEIELAITRSTSYNTPGAKIELKQIWAAAKDPKTWAFVWIAVGSNLGLTSLGLFLPTFIVEFGYTPLHTQLLSIIPSASATVTLLIVTQISDRFNVKGIAILFCQAIACIGYIILLTVSSNAVKVAGASFVASGVYSIIVMDVAWISINVGGFTKRSATWGFAEIIGQAFGIAGTHIYDGPPKFTKGHSIILGFLVFGMLNTMAVMFWMKHLNKKRDHVAAEYAARGEIDPRVHRSLEEEYDYHPSFRYII